jgi:hypothetical protein
MRNLPTFLKDTIRKPPVVFPLIALFHIFCLIYVVYESLSTPLPYALFQPVWLLAYTISWIAICDLRKWGGASYVIISCVNLGIYLMLRSPADRIYNSDLFLIDLIFCVVVIIFYKKLK